MRQTERQSNKYNWHCLQYMPQFLIVKHLKYMPLRYPTNAFSVAFMHFFYAYTRDGSHKNILSSFTLNLILNLYVFLTSV